MMKPVLIARTVSIEKLATVIESCRAEWPERPLWVLTNAGRAAEVEALAGVARAIRYEGGAGGFSAGVELETELWAVVVPVANAGGSGYANVLRACRGLRARRWALCARCSRLRFLSRIEWEAKWRSEWTLRAIAAFLGSYWGERMLDREER